jgi:putative transferase (TIGR04331 family)
MISHNISKTQTPNSVTIHEDNIAINDIYYDLEVKYEKYCIALSSEMNKLHSQNLSMKSWERIFGPWLFFFLHYCYNQWTVGQQNSKTILNDYSFWIFHQYSSFLLALGDEQFSNDFQQITIYYIRNRKLPAVNEVVAKPCKKKSIRSFLINIVNNLLQLKTLFLLRITNNKIVFCEAHLPNSFLLKLSKRWLNIISAKFLARPIFSPRVSYLKRQMIDISLGDDEFDIYFANMVKLFMPSAYLESFSYYISFPFIKHRSNTIKTVSANGIYNNESFKFFCAFNNHCELVGVPHGGLDYYISKHFPWRYIENRIFDRYYPYWRTDHTVLIPSVRAWEENLSPISGCKKLLFVTTKQDRILCYYPKITSYFTQLIENGFRFVDELVKKYDTVKIYHKPHFEDNIWNYHKLLRDKFPDNIYLETSQDLGSVRNQYSIYIFDHISTGVLQCLYSRYPFLICVPPLYIDKYYDQTGVHEVLEKLGLLYYNAVDAAKFITNSVNIEDWWDSIKTSDPYVKLLEMLGVDLDPYSSWNGMLDEVNNQ